VRGGLAGGGAGQDGDGVGFLGLGLGFWQEGLLGYRTLSLSLIRVLRNLWKNS
jgi:hypothetical protein